MSERRSLPAAPQLGDGWHAVVKRDCPTCVVVAPVVRLLAHEDGLQAWSQDDASFPDDMAVQSDESLAVSWHYDIDTVPTLLRIEDGAEVERLVGWQRSDWEQALGRSLTTETIGAEMADWMPGCGSLSVDPDRVAALDFDFGGSRFRSCLLYTSPSPRDGLLSRMPSSA